MTNKEVVLNFLNGKNAHSLNMRSQNGRLYSYNTCIAEIVKREDNKPILIVNKTKYSTTTSGKHQRPLYNNMSPVKYDIREISNVPQDTYSLTRFLK